MGKEYEKIDDQIARWIEQQKIFFVATAPLSESGHVNCSPKGGDSFRIIDPHTVAYQDLTGSGIETIAHLKENKRITIMFCAFEGPPKIIRLQGQGSIHLPGEDRYKELDSLFSDTPGVRSIIHIHVERVSDSCGFGVPVMKFKSNRDDLTRWAKARTSEEMEQYRTNKNSESIDGLPGL